MPIVCPQRDAIEAVVFRSRVSNHYCCFPEGSLREGMDFFIGERKIFCHGVSPWKNDRSVDFTGVNAAIFDFHQPQKMPERDDCRHPERATHAVIYIDPDQIGLLQVVSADRKFIIFSITEFMESYKPV